METLRKLGKPLKSQLASESLIPFLNHVDSIVRIFTMSILEHWGVGSDSVIESLIRLLKDQDSTVRGVAIQALGKLDDNSISLLLPFLEDPDPSVQCSAALAVGTWKQYIEMALKTIDSLAKDSDSEVRTYAVEALRGLGDHLEISIDLLLALLKDCDESVGFNAVYALGEIGYKSDRILESLTNALEDKCLDSHAAEALGKLSIYSEKSVNLMFPLLLTEHFGDKEKVKSALIKLGEFHQEQFLPPTFRTKPIIN
jgi:HEAT repeat protein